MLQKSTRPANPGDSRKWFIVDAKDQVLGRGNARQAPGPHDQGGRLGHAPEEHDRAQDDDARQGLRG